MSGARDQSPVHPLALVLQHDRRLFEIENQIPAALDTINSNIDVLSEGYNALTGRLDEQATAPEGVQTATGAQALIDTKVNTALSEALAAKTLAAGATAACESFRINDMRELHAAHEELKTDRYGNHFYLGYIFHLGDLNTFGEKEATMHG